MLGNLFSHDEWSEAMAFGWARDGGAGVHIGVCLRDGAFGARLD